MVAAAFDDALPRLRETIGMLLTIGACHVTVVHRSWPLGEHPLDVDDARAGDALFDEFAGMAGAGVLQVVVSPRIELIEKYLDRVATDVHADLIVIGSHHREGLDRLIHRDAEDAVLRRTSANVLVVPVG